MPDWNHTRAPRDVEGGISIRITSLPAVYRRLAALAMGCLVAAIVGAAGPVAIAAACGSSGQPIVATDKGDYQPGDTVVIAGTDFPCDAPLTVAVTPPSGVVAQIAATADGSGAFTADYPIPAPADDPSGLYTVRVSDSSGSVLASTTFVDTHFRYATFSWVRSTTNPNTVTFDLETSWRWNFPWPSGTDPAVGTMVNTGYPFQFGDGQQADIFLKVLSVNAAQDWFVGTATLTHTYASPGTYTAQMLDCCRLSTLLENNHDQNFLITTKVSIGGAVTQSPQSSLSPIIYCPSTGTCTFRIPAIDLEPGATATYAFSPQSLSDLPTPVPTGPAGAATISATGQFSWNTTGASVGLYATQVQIGETDSSGTALPTYIVDDFIIDVVNGQLPAFVAPTPANGSTLTAYATQPLTFQVAAQTPNTGATVSVSPVVLPAGAALTCPAPGASTSCTFAWTPTYAQVGQYILNFNAQDTLGLSAQPLSLTVDVAGDTAPPTVSATVTPGPDANGWNNSAVSVGLTATDPSPAGQAPASGVASLTYAVDGGTPVTVSGSTASVAVSGDGTHTVVYSATDNAGNQSAQQTQVVKIDTVAPTISGSPTTAPNAAGWYNSNVTIHWTYADNAGGSGIDPATAPADTVISTEGTGLTATAAVSDLAGNTATATSAPTVNIDKTPPTVAATLQPAANANGWSRGPVQVNLSASDQLSGVQSLTYALDGGTPVTVSGSTASVAVSGDGTHTVVYSATDNAGNQSTPQTQTVKIDSVPPTISGAPTTAPNAAGWYNSNVTIHWTYSDNAGGSGIDPTTAPADSVISSEGTSLAATATVADLAGNTATATSAPAVNIDKTPPTIGIQGVQNGATYTLGAAPTPSYTATDALSGVASSSATLQKPATASGAGTYTYTVTATDKAGNTATATVTYQVDYQWGGFDGSVTNGETVNANQTVPLKFVLRDASGNVVSGAVATLDVNGQPAVPQGSANQGDQFTFDGNHYQYQLKLRDQGVSSGTVTLTIHLDDGSVQTVTLNLK